MVVSDSAKILFLHVPRTGGTTTTEVLLKNLPDAKMVLPQHASVKTAPPNFFEQYSDYFKFTFVRNPWDRMVSWYSLLKMSHDDMFKNIQTLGEFADSVRGYYWFNQIDHLCDENGNIFMDRICRHEDFENELVHVLNTNNIPYKSIPRLNHSERQEYRSYYTEGCKELIAELCHRDIEYFSYRF